MWLVHMLVQEALIAFVFSEIEMTEEEEHALLSLMSNEMVPSIDDINECSTLKMLFGKFETALEKLKARCPTAELWVQ